MDVTEQRVRKTIEEYHMLDPGDRVSQQYQEGQIPSAS